MDPRRTFEPFVGFFGVSGLGPDEKWWCFTDYRSTVDAMRGKPASVKSHRKELESNKGYGLPSVASPACPFTGTIRRMVS